MTTLGGSLAAHGLAVRGLRWPEVREGDDLVALLCAGPDLRDGDIIVITSKVVSKSEGRLVRGDRNAAIRSQTRRVVARRGATVIAETSHGLVLAAAGVDASNTPPGTVLLLPGDPDASARAVRVGVHALTGRNVAVVVSDTGGRAWRIGQTDIAIGCAGLDPLLDLEGTRDTHGNVLLVTAAAVADELAAAADLVKAKTSHQPVAVVRGMASVVLPPDEHGPGARSLVRDAADDLFGLGVREAAVAAALRDDPDSLARFAPRAGGDPPPMSGLLEGWHAALPPAARDRFRTSISQAACPEASGEQVWRLEVDGPADAGAEVWVAVGRLLERADVLAAAHHLTGHDGSPDSGQPRRDGRALARCWHTG